MDPDAAWAEAVGLAREIGVDTDDESADAARLAELVLALNEWAKKGGFPPKVFQQK